MVEESGQLLWNRQQVFEQSENAGKLQLPLFCVNLCMCSTVKLFRQDTVIQISSSVLCFLQLIVL